MIQMTKSFLSRANGKVSAFVADEEGATAAEYGLIAALIAVAIIVAVKGLGTQLKSTFNNITSSLPTGSGGN